MMQYVINSNQWQREWQFPRKNKWDEEIKWDDTIWGEMNNKMNEEGLKWQQNAEHEYDSLFNDAVEVSP